MYKNILVGTDGSATAAIAVERAVEVAAATGARLTILTVDREERGRKTLDDVAGRHADSGVDIQTKVLQGDPASVLVDETESGGYDLLVVGNKGMTGASRFFLGSVPNKVSHHAPTALLIVRTT
ncbi:MAG: universal stress protein [Actinobacteria bacterium]|jgi:nucleotide-binding universal stress UspA family protein|nr:universal stress protein [Actinomycetota bacterium]MBV8958728.1 universal stress protein [Actinomycetota bacterium]MBV9935308.1 universal stress protein [Actinomycetota bacterium]